MTHSISMTWSFKLIRDYLYYFIFQSSNVLVIQFWWLISAEGFNHVKQLISC